MFRINTYILNCDLVAEVLPQCLPPDAEYACYLYCGKEVLVKYGYRKEPVFHFLLECPGIYYVRAFARWKPSGQNTYKTHALNGKRLRFVGKSHLNEYRAFLQTASEIELPTLPFIHLEYPKQDLLVAAVRTGDPGQCRQAMEALGAELSLHMTHITPTVTVLSELRSFQQEERHVIFSGMGRTEDRLIVGMNDIDSYATAQALTEQIGTFCLLRSDGNTLTLETDFAGTDKLYYYTSPQVFLVSNRVHLILLAMKQMGIARNPNMTRIYAGLCHSFLTRQNFCQELNVEGVIALRADSRLRLDLSDQTVRVEKTALHSLLSNPSPYTPESYRAGLKEAADEVATNARLALEHPAFDKLVVQVTGGMDSRAVLCALSRFPQHRHKVIAKTVKTDLAGDFDIAMKLLSKFHLPFGGIPRKATASHSPNWQFEVLSTHLAATPETGKSLDPANRLPGERVCLLPGSSGEAFSRAYYSGHLRCKSLGDSTCSDRSFSSLLTEYINGNIYTIFDAREDLRNTLVQECMSLPGRSNLEKYENHYLFYRNGLHFNTAYDYHPFAPAWGVLQSKALLRLRVMTYLTPVVDHLELDLLYALNPELVSVEFESQTYNALRDKLDQQFHCYPTCREYDEAAIQALIGAWEENAQAEPVSEAAASDQTVVLTEPTLLMETFRTLVSRLRLRETAACALYGYLNHQKTHPEYGNVVRKLYSLYYELYL